MGEVSELVHCIELEGGRPSVDFGRAGTSTEVSRVVIDASSIDFLLGCGELEDDDEVDKEEDVAKRWRADNTDGPDEACRLPSGRVGADKVRLWGRRCGAVIVCGERALVVS